MSLIRNISIGLSTSMGGFVKGFGQASQTLDRFGASAARAGASAGGLGSIARVAAGFGVFRAVEGAIGGVVGGIKASIKGASDLNETLSKTEAVFGPGAKAVIGQADDMAREFGLSKGAMLDAASGIGLIGKAAGQSGPEAATMANDLAKLAADASSFYNVPLDEALQKIKSGLVGESEPIRAFGVLLNEDAVKAQALAMGAREVGGKLSESSKVMARAALITKGLGTASGDLAKTADAPANAFRKFTGTLENLAASVGTAMMPAIKTAVGLLNEFAQGAVASYERNRAGFAGFVATITAGLEVVGTLFRNWPDVLEIAWLKIQEVFTNFGRVIEVIPANLGIVAAYIGDNWYKLIVDAVMAVQSVFTNLGKNLVTIGQSIWDALNGKGFHFDPKALTPLLDGFKALSAKLPDFIKPELIDVTKEIEAVQQRLTDKAAALGAMVKPGAAGAGGKPGETPGAAAEKGATEARSNAATEFGSAEAISAIAKLNMGGKDALMDVNKKQLTAQERIAVAVEKFNQTRGGEVLPFAL